MKKTIESAVLAYIQKFNEESLLELLRDKTSQNHVLTIIANSGVHPYDTLHQRGEVFIASYGNLNFQSEESARKEIENILIKVAKKLKECRWNKVYLVPFGPAPLSLQIKSLVYKILDVETIDVLHAGDGKHYDIELDPRTIAISAEIDL